MYYHLFNPGHDEALAANDPNYNDTKVAQVLAADLSSLPAHWAAQGDVWTLPADWSEVEGIVPWGWNVAVARRLYRAGAPLRLLPSEEELAAIRWLSSRQRAVEWLPRLSSFRSCWCESMAEVEAAIREWGYVYIKAPWSSSGRGILRSDGRFTVSEAGRVRRWIAQQGAVVVEPAHRKLLDFAVEYRLGKEGASYEGLSVFATEGGRAYSGSLVAEEVYLRSLLPDVDGVIEEVRRALEGLAAGRYTGVVGVDMMVLENGDIHPLVEMNFRHTMGWVAVQLVKYLPAGKRGRYFLRPVALSPSPEPGFSSSAPFATSEVFCSPALGVSSSAPFATSALEFSSPNSFLPPASLLSSCSELRLTPQAKTIEAQIGRAHV